MHDMNPMSETPAWNPGPVCDWLLAEGRMLPDMHTLVHQLGARLQEAGAPLWRLRLSMRVLHPLTTAVSAVWEDGNLAAEHIETPHGLERQPGYTGSPLALIVQTGQPFRKRLDADLGPEDHEILHELKSRGVTDYYGLRVFFMSGNGCIPVFNTCRPGGFTDSDIEGFNRISALLGPIAEVHCLQIISAAVAEAYLGRRTGRRVLSGQITRGHIETLDAAILISDIRGWTTLNAQIGATAALDLANRYFTLMGAAVEAGSGEILKLTGDGVLAVFPAEDRGAAAACRHALSAAQSAFHAAEQADLGVSFGIGLHFGEVLYGNVGSDTRLDFTAMGPAVNAAARIEGLCSELGTPLLCSEDYAGLAGGAFRETACRQLKGEAQARRVYTPKSA